MKTAKTNGRRSKSETTKAKRSKASARRKKSVRVEPTANELMLEAWKKLYETRRERLL